MDTDGLRKAIHEAQYYGAAQLLSIARLAHAIHSVRDSKTRRELTREFESVIGRSVSVWSRVISRFGDIVDRLPPDGILALSFMCQLPEEQCSQLYALHCDHLDEPNVHILVRADVDECIPRRNRVPTAPLVEAVAALVRAVDSGNIEAARAAAERVRADKRVARLLESPEEGNDTPRC